MRSNQIAIEIGYNEVLFRNTFYLAELAKHEGDDASNTMYTRTLHRLLKDVDPDSNEARTVAGRLAADGEQRGRRRRMRTIHMTRVIGLAFVGLASVGFASAEVGVSLDAAPAQNPAPRCLYKLSIVDGGDPIGFVWSQYTADPRRAVLNPAGAASGDGEPLFVLNPVSGLPIVTWARNSAQGFDVVVSAFANGVSTTPYVVEGSTANELDPDVFLDPSGNVHIVYWVDNGTSQTVFHVQATPDLASWSAPERVSSLGEAACRPVGIVHGGIVRLVYELHTGGYGTAPRAVVLTRKDGSNFVAEVIATTNNTSDVRPGVHSQSGQLWVDWVDAHGSTEFEGEMAWVRLGGNGSWGPVSYEPFGNRLERELTTRATIRLDAVVP